MHIIKYEGVSAFRKGKKKIIILFKNIFIKILTFMICIFFKKKIRPCPSYADFFGHFARSKCCL